MAYKLYARQEFKTTVYDEEYIFTCYTQNTDYGFRHICTYGYNNTDVCKYIKDDIISKATYYNRTWERFKYETVLSRGIEKLDELPEIKNKLHEILIEGKAVKEHVKAEKEFKQFQELYNKTSPELKEKLANMPPLTNDTQVGIVKMMCAMDILMNNGGNKNE